MFQQYDEQTASTEDRIAWVLCQIIDDDAPMRWTRYRFVAECIAGNEKLMADLNRMGPAKTLTDDQIDRIAENCAKSMPDGIQGFCKTWGWRQFARELLDVCAGYSRAARHPTLDECEKAGIGPVNAPGKGYSEGGLPNTAEERARFEAYMRGHCWDFGTFDAKTNSYDTVDVRRLYGVWRDRGWLAMKAAQPNGE